MSELPVISQSDDWIDLGDGVEAVLLARLDTVLRDGSLLLSFADWSSIAVPVTGVSPFREPGLDRLRTEGLGQRVRLVVVRTEDGIEARADSLVAAEIL